MMMAMSTTSRISKATTETRIRARTSLAAPGVTRTAMPTAVEAGGVEGHLVTLPPPSAPLGSGQGG
jgi:hypothetical protein